MTVGAVLAGLAAHPRQNLIDRWNWKSALLSAGLRGAIFFSANLTVSLDAAVRAMAVDATFRIPMVGVYAAVIQAFADAEPPWLAACVVTVAVPAVAHGVEFTVHAIARTPALAVSVAASVAFSILSSAFNLFAMRHGALRVGPRSSSFRSDVRRFPGLVVAFVVAGPMAVIRAIRGLLAP